MGLVNISRLKIAAVVLTLLNFAAFAQITFAGEIDHVSIDREMSDWLATERDDSLLAREKTQLAVEEFLNPDSTAPLTQHDLRLMIEGIATDEIHEVEKLISSEEVLASDWITSLPASKPKDTFSFQLKSPYKVQCHYNQDSLYECASISQAMSHSDAGGVSDAKSETMLLAPAPSKNLMKQKIALSNSDTVKERTTFETRMESNAANAAKSAQSLGAALTKKDGASVQIETSSDAVSGIKLFRGSAGVVTVQDGKITLSQVDQSRPLILAPEVRKNHVSVFIRDPSVAHVDAEKLTITAKLQGVTELFVVSKDRISIIPVHVSGKNFEGTSLAGNFHGSFSHEKALEALTPTSKPGVLKNSLGDLQLPSGLASLDLLDRAAQSGGNMHAAFGGSKSSAAALSANGELDPLKVPAELTEIDSDLDKVVSFSHAKAKTSFNKVFVRFMDERSSWDLTKVFPVGGLRVRIIGTEFHERADGQGYLEISDVPSGSRILLEIVDDSGGVMPAFAEVYADGAAAVKSKALPIIVRRYIAWDYATRMAGLTQDMQRASLCGTVMDTGARKVPLVGVKVGINAKAHGPYYFNDLGYLDTRLGATKANGRFCFFNVDPGAASIAFERVVSANDQQERQTGTVVVMTARGRHTEEYFALEDARHITTTVASVPTAGEQLSSDAERANRYLAVDHAEVLPIGYKDAMVPIDEGVYSSSEPVVPLRGRVWTVANSSDYEVSVQATSVRLPGSRQITSLLPRGFIDDMMNYAQADHNYDLGSVVVEHAMVSGQGSDSVKIKLIDTQGKQTGDGWYFADQPLAKAIFFNVPAGVYTAIIETATGHWIAADTVVAYPETSTFVRTGAPLEKHISRASVEN